MYFPLYFLKGSFIVVFKGENEYYIGNKDFYGCVSTLPSFGEYSYGKNDNILIDQKSSTLTVAKTFIFLMELRDSFFL